MLISVTNFDIQPIKNIGIIKLESDILPNLNILEEYIKEYEHDSGMLVIETPNRNIVVYQKENKDVSLLQKIWLYLSGMILPEVINFVTDEMIRNFIPLLLSELEIERVKKEEDKKAF